MIGRMPRRAALAAILLAAVFPPGLEITRSGCDRKAE
jgi:hypothetical protein